jgi:Fe-S oxidoreductase/FAD/FMN-containing dehydrogenase
MIGGMVGNNSCGANSIVYGSTRDHLVRARGFLSDGSEVTFGPMTKAEFAAKCAGPATLECRIYRLVQAILGDPRRQQLIRDQFPKPGVTRRNTGYALDALLDNQVFDAKSNRPFNLCRLIAGSEGTLFFGVEFELNCEPLPPPGYLLCAHFTTINEALRATQVAMRMRPSGCELIDRKILECTKSNHEQAKNRFFLDGDPGAVLVVEIQDREPAVIDAKMAELTAQLKAAGLGYAYPVVRGADCERVWELRRAGQGLVNNLPGPAQPREIVEDTAVALEDLPEYITEFDAILRDKYGVDCIYYAHAGAGELHTRPLFNLKTEPGLKMFRDIATDIATLVKKYRGSLSGEHGDGRLRGEFIKFMVGDECYGLMRLFKETFDPKGIFNPGKIIDTPPMDTSLRHGPHDANPHYETFFDFDSTDGVLGATEKCTGVGECRKSHLTGGTMCPSYMATKNEKDTTRARANILREVLTRPRNAAQPWNSPEVKAVMDLCLSCKGCKSECPSNVDVGRLKAEWQQHYYDANGVPLRSRLVAGFGSSMRLASLAPWFHNWLTGSSLVSPLLKKFAGFARGRSLPPLPHFTLEAWYRRNAQHAGPFPNGKVHFFCDEFTNFYDAKIGARAIELLHGLGYEVIIPKHTQSGRAHLSKGLVRQAREFARENVRLLANVVTHEAPLIGIEPSAILSFRDEYPALLTGHEKAAANALSKNVLTIDEFFAREKNVGKIRAEQFTAEPRSILLHGHCHQKALSSTGPTVAMLQLPKNYKVEVIPSGCCGMAGSFGYEAEHFAVSQQIGELVLFPAVRNAAPDIQIAAPGTSCRHQIHDGTGRTAQHPVEVLADALIGG